MTAATQGNAQCQSAPTVVSPPAGLWDTLTPFPIAFDLQSDQSGFFVYNASHPTWADANYADGFVMVNGFHGWDLFDVRTPAKKESPERIYGMDGWSWTGYGAIDPRGTPLGFPAGDQRKLSGRSWISFGEADAAGGEGAAKAWNNKIYFASTGLNGDVGLTIWEFDPAAWVQDPGNTSNRGAAPRIIYALTGTGFNDLDFAIAKNASGQDRLYLYASATTSGIYTFNVSAAASSPCLAADPCLNDANCKRDKFENNIRQAGSTCSSTIFKGVTSGTGHFMDTVDREGSSPAYLVAAAVFGSEIYSLAQGSAPVSLGNVRDNEGTNRLVFSTAMWRTGSTLAVATFGLNQSTGFAIHDVSSCVISGNCDGNATRTYFDTGLARQKQRMIKGKVGGRTYLWSGEPKRCGTSTNDKEQLWDVTSIGNVVDLTPTLTQNIGGDLVNYFQYYYPQNASGFDWFLPEGGDFTEDGYFFRAGYQSIGTHKIDDPSPNLSITGPALTFLGDGETYSATALNCTVTTGWSWQTDEDTGTNVNVENNGSSATITWQIGSGIVADTIRVTNPGCAGAEGTLTVTIADPVPDIQQVAINGTSIGNGATVQLQQCTEANFTTVTIGRNPLSYSWSIQPAQVTGSSSTLEWSVGNALGSEALSLGASNNDGSDSFSATLDIQALAALGFAGAPIVNQAGQSGSLTVDANSTGASEWQWELAPAGGSFSIVSDFGDGLRIEPFSLSTGDWDIRVSVRNCLSGAIETSTIVSVNVVANPPVAALEVDDTTCSVFGAFCSAEPGAAIGFVDQSTGSITSYRYDFTHTGSTTSSCALGSSQSTPRTSFTYSVVGLYRPCVEVTGPGGSDIALLGTPGTPSNIEIAVQNPPSISVSCSPSAVLTGQTSTCSATATNCAPSPSGWNWTSSGGTGASSSSSIGLQWSSAGSKTVRATNSSCGSAQGSRTVTVSTGGGGGGDLDAVAVITPATPSVGETVTLNGASSTGAIVSYSWSVRQGSTTVASYSTAVATHVFTGPGSYQVSLSVSDEPGCANAACFDTDSQTIVVGGSAGLGANFTLTPSAPEQGQTVALNGGSSTGDVVAYVWTVVPPSGPTDEFTGQTVLYQFEQAGNYTISLTVHDVVGCTASDCRDTLTKVIDIKATEVLEARIRVLPEGGPIAGVFFTLDASTSTGGPNSWIWTIDGQDFPGETLTLRIDEVSDVSVTLTVSNGSASVSATEVLHVLGDCDPSGDVLCLSGRRFRVEAAWETAGGDQGVGMPFDTGTPDSGLFWFFQAENAEMLVKMVDGCGFNDHYWVSVAATTNVGYTLVVTDVVTDDSYTVTNQIGVASPAVLDIEAFATCDAAGRTETPAVAAWYTPSVDEVAQLRAEYAASLLAEQTRQVEAGEAWATRMAARLEREAQLSDRGYVGVTENMGTCVVDNETFCFNEGRFEAKVNYRDETEATGPGVVTPFVTDDSGVYYFFQQDNWELLVKMVEGCPVNENHWVFVAATTDQEFTLTVKDTLTGAEKVYFNPMGTRADAITDFEAFPCG